MIESLRIREPRLGSAACEFGLVARSAIMAMTLTLISACHPRGDEARAAPGASTPAKWSGSTFSSQITGYNHTDKTIASFNVNGVWGGNVTPHANGGDTCCLQLPQAWRQDLHVRIDWEDDQGQQHSRDVPVPRYDPNSIGIFNVHFLRSGEIKVFDINAGLGHPDYPLKGEEANLKPGVPNFQWPREVPASK